MQRIDEASLVQLYNSAVEAFPETKKRQHATDTIVVTDLDWMPFKGMKTLFVKGLAQNEGRQYNTIVLFKKVKYYDEPQREAAELVANDGLTYYFDRLSDTSQDVLVRCNCNDFKYRFNYQDHIGKSLYGTKVKAYKSEGLRGPANPLGLPGMCKHLMKTMTVLNRAGVFLGS